MVSMLLVGLLMGWWILKIGGMLRVVAIGVFLLILVHTIAIIVSNMFSKWFQGLCCLSFCFLVFSFKFRLLIFWVAFILGLG
jgi:hypothetical protein